MDRKLAGFICITNVVLRIFAALLVWRLLYLLLPLALSIPVILLFERSQLGKATKGLSPPPGSH